MDVVIAGAEPPRYKSHKTVWALEIADVTGTVLMFAEKGYAPIEASVEMFSRYTPAIGDFLVIYEDGYKSFSPRKAFIEGYSRSYSADDTLTIIARACHEVNRAYCASIGDNSQPAWADAPEWQRVSAINGVKFSIANPDASPSASHDSWSAEKVAAGWVYGPVKDPEAKQHPCLVPYDELPLEQRTKDYLFQAVVRSLA